MKKKDKIETIEEVANDLLGYLSSFNSPLAPRGEGAKAKATEEFLDLTACVVYLLRHLNKKEKNMLVCMLLEVIARLGISLLDYEDADAIIKKYFEKEISKW